ncbi:MAG: bifunctional folylpolyglutamate synthase/dihydrofolate synthase, partial [Candidatus Kapaibacteriales bacterium]
DKLLIEKLFSLRRFGIKPGLERINYILGKLNSPQNHLQVIHIAGTNGKGSVAAILASVLKEAGYKVGLYTSPHIFSYNERIRINGIPIPDCELEPKIEKVLEIGKEVEATFFEITTAIALDYFNHSKVDYVVLETGMGGRYDATNIILHPIISILTRIDLDHQEYLGKTIEEISTEKAGIIKHGHLSIIAPNDYKVYSAIFRSVPQKDQILLAEYLTKFVDASYSKLTKFPVMVVSIDTFYNKYRNLITLLIGYHQVENIITSLVAIETFQIPLRISEEHIYNGLLNLIPNTGLHCRIEFLQADPPFVVDVAHNPNAIQMTVKTLREIYPDDEWNIIFSAMKDKNIKGMLKSLLPIAKRFLIPNLTFDRAERNNNIHNMLEEVLQENGSSKKPEIMLFETPNKALSYSIKFSEPTLVIGSFYLLSELVLDLKHIFDWYFDTSGVNQQI